MICGIRSSPKLPGRILKVSKEKEEQMSDGQLAETNLERIVAAARCLHVSDLLARWDQWPQLPVDDLRSYVESSQQVLETAHQLLQRPCRVTVEFSWEFYNRHCGEFTPLRNLARAFMLEASLARRERRESDAVRIALDGMRLGVAVRNGGLITDLLVGMALTGTASGFLGQCRSHLGADTALAAAREILRIEMSQESFAAIAERDAHWETAVGNGPQETLPPPRRMTLQTCPATKRPIVP
jgi:hypothetical protein